MTMTMLTDVKQPESAQQHTP